MTAPDHPIALRDMPAVLTLLIVLGLVVCYLVLEPFVPALVWAMTLALLFSPLESRLRQALRSPVLSTAITAAIAAVTVVIPAVLVSRALIDELVVDLQVLGTLLTEQGVEGLAQTQPWLSRVLRWFSAHLPGTGLIETFAGKVGEWTAGFVQGSVSSLIHLLLTFYFLFYLLRDRSSIVELLRRALPLSQAEFRMCADRVVGTIYASVYGTLAVAVLQGTLGGLMFWWLGLSSPVFWGMIMGLLAIVPFLGAFIVWVPAAIGLGFDGQWLSAGVLTVWGILVVGLIDNIVYPILVGRTLAVHSMLSFIAIIGGLLLFGSHGIVLGPIIMTLTWTLVGIWRERMEIKPLLEAGPESTD